MNGIGQRTNLGMTGTAFDAVRSVDFGYDSLGQVTKADSTIPGLDRAYQYDLIGNRLKTADSLTLPTGNNYTPNALNQYTAIDSLTPSYDDDGNMTSGPLPANLSANSTLVWDGENRLIEAQVNSGGTVSYIYDSQSRRIAETIGIATTVYVYDGWNPIAEYSTTYALTKTYTWGIDLSGSMQGAGGVGGLLAVTDSSGTHYPTFDGNGNVSEYLDSTGNTVAHYEYDPFGKTTVSNGTKANDFAHRFSTKPLDVTTGLYYYGYRFYDPETGRWPSRDPLGERGGLNLYGFAGNDGPNRIDYLGLSDGFWGMAGDWFTGEHDPETHFGPESIQVQDLIRSASIAQLREYFLNKNKNNCPGWEGVTNWGPPFDPIDLNGNFWQDMGNGTVHFIGKLIAEIEIVSETFDGNRLVRRPGGRNSLDCDSYKIVAKYTVKNTTSVDSLFRFLPGDQSGWNIIDESRNDMIPGDPNPMSERTRYVDMGANWRQVYEWEETYYCETCVEAYDGCTDGRRRPDAPEPEYDISDFFNF